MNSPPCGAPGAMSRRFPLPKFVLALLAGLLALTTGLKLHLLLTSPFADIATATPLPVLWLALFAELVVIGVIISRVPSEIKWLVVTGFFAVLAAVSLYNVFSGKTTCGCAGGIELHPITFLIVNILVLLLLCLIFPQNSQFMAILSKSGEFYRQRITPNFGAVLGVLASIMIFLFSQSTIGREIYEKHYRGNDIFVKPVSLGVINKSSTETIAEVRLTNLSDFNITILDVKTSCSCVAVSSLINSSLPPHSATNVKVSFFRKRSGSLRERMIVRTNSKRQPVVVVDFIGFWE